MSNILDSSEFSVGGKKLQSRRKETDSGGEKSVKEDEFDLGVSATARDSARPEIERYSEGESEADAGQPSVATELQDAEANAINVVPRNYPTLLPCHSCELILTSVDNYKKHCREQHYSHSCRFCETMTVSYGRLRKHLLTCHPAAMKEETRSEVGLESDEKQQLGPDDCDEAEPLLSKSCKKKIRRCTKCCFASDDLVDFGEHMFNAHGDKKYKAKLIDCPLCPFMTYIQHHMDYHMNSEHLKQRIYQCDKCEYSGYNLSMLNSHANSHSPIHRYRCAECNFVAKHSNLMKVHEKRTGHRRAPDWNKDGSLPSFLITADVLQRLISQKQRLGDASGISDELLNRVKRHIQSRDDDDQKIHSAVKRETKIDDCPALPSVDKSQGRDHMTTGRSSLPPLPGTSQPAIPLQAGNPFAPPAAVDSSSSIFQQQQSLNRPFPVQYPQFPAFPQIPFTQQSAISSFAFNEGFAFSPSLQVSNQTHMSPTLPTSRRQQQQEMMTMVAQIQHALYFNYPPANLPNLAIGMYNVGFPHPFQIPQMNQWPLQNGLLNNAAVFGSVQQKTNSVTENSQRKRSRQPRRRQTGVITDNNSLTLNDSSSVVTSPQKHIKIEAIDYSSAAIDQHKTSHLSTDAVSESTECPQSVMTTTDTGAGMKFRRITGEVQIKGEKQVTASAEVSLVSAKRERLAEEDGTMKTLIASNNSEGISPRGSKVNDFKISNLSKSKRSVDSICECLMTKKLRKEEDTLKQTE